MALNKNKNKNKNAPNIVINALFIPICGNSFIIKKYGKTSRNPSNGIEETTNKSKLLIFLKNSLISNFTELCVCGKTKSLFLI